MGIKFIICNLFMTFKKILFVFFFCLLNGSTALARDNKAKAAHQKSDVLKKNFRKKVVFVLKVVGIVVLFALVWECYRQYCRWQQQAIHILPEKERAKILQRALKKDKDRKLQEASEEARAKNLQKVPAEVPKFCTICRKKVEGPAILFSKNCNDKCRFHAPCLSLWNMQLLSRKHQPHCPFCKTNFNEDNMNIIKAEVEAEQEAR